MPWKETCVMEERMRFVLAAKKEGAVMTLVCAEAGISRQRGYTLLRRYEAEGVAGGLRKNPPDGDAGLQRA